MRPTGRAARKVKCVVRSSEPYHQTALKSLSVRPTNQYDRQLEINQTTYFSTIWLHCKFQFKEQYYVNQSCNFCVTEYLEACNYY